MAYTVLCCAIVMFVLTMFVIAGPTQSYQILAEGIVAFGALWVILLAADRPPGAARGENVLTLLTVFFTFATLGPLIIMVFGGDEAGLVAGVVAACISGLISVGWAAAFAFRALWLLPFVIAFQVLVPGEIFAWLSDRGAFENTGELSMRARMGILAAISVVCVVVGYALFLRLVGGIERGRAKAEAQLDTAAAIHAQIVPALDETIGGARVAGRSIASSTMGGDFIDLIRRSDGSADIILADVSGHGVRAGVLMALAKGATRAALRAEVSVADAVGELNRTLFEATDAGTFVTAIIARVRPQASGTVTMTLVNAGHPPAVLIGERNRGRLEPGGLPLGVSDDERYAPVEFELVRGSALVLHSDGIPEAGAGGPGQLGLEAVDRYCASAPPAAPSAIVEGLIDLARAHARPDDDMSVLVLSVS